MDHLTDLLNHASSADQPAGEQRVQALADKLRGLDVDLTALQQQARDRFEQLYADGDYNPDDAAMFEALADITDAAQVVAAEKQQQQQRVEALADRVRTQPTSSSGGPVHDTTSERADHHNGGDGSGGDKPGGDGSSDTTSGGQTGESAPHPDNSPQEPAPEPAAPRPDSEPAPAPEPDPSPSAPSDNGDEPAPTQPEGSTSPAQPEPVAASAASSTAASPAPRPSTAAALNQSRTNAVRRTQPPQNSKPLRSYTITAAAEIPDYPFGHSITMSELADAAASRFATLPVGQPASGPIKANVARISRHFDDSIRLTGNQSDVELMDRVADEKRLPGGSLVAAVMSGYANLTAATQAPATINDVWCTPSETDYTLCPPLATREGMLDLPTTGMPSRGGIRYPVWNQYPEQAAAGGMHGEVITYPDNPADPGTGLDNPGYFRTTENGGLGNTKKCISGPCVEWREQRANVAYLCITSDILRDRTFPEGIERFMSDVMTHHAHYLNETYIGYIAANADPIPAFSVQNGPGQIGSTSLTVIDRLSLLVTWFRGRYKMAEDATLEIVAPTWFREYLKRDIEKKQNRPFGAVNNAEIASLFAAYASRVQWVQDWQDIDDGTPVGGRIMPPGDWPGAVNILAYPAGSWVLSEGNIITLGVQYDYQLLQENRYSASFTEDSWMLINRCNRTFMVQLTDLSANGAIGPSRDTTSGGATTVQIAGPIETHDYRWNPTNSAWEGTLADGSGTDAAAAPITPQAQTLSTTASEPRTAYATTSGGESSDSGDTSSKGDASSSDGGAKGSGGGKSSGSSKK